MIKTNKQKNILLVADIAGCWNKNPVDESSQLCELKAWFFFPIHQLCTLFTPGYRSSELGRPHEMVTLPYCLHVLDTRFPIWLYAVYSSKLTNTTSAPQHGTWVLNLPVPANILVLPVVQVREILATFFIQHRNLFHFIASTPCPRKCSEPEPTCPYTCIILSATRQAPCF